MKLQSARSEEDVVVTAEVARLAGENPRFRRFLNQVVDDGGPEPRGGSRLFRSYFRPGLPGISLVTEPCRGNGRTVVIDGEY